MRVTVTGSLGNISRPLVKQLISAGHEVRVITSSPVRIKEIELLGATAVVGKLDSQEVLNWAFEQADAAYLMIPPSYSTTQEIIKVGEEYAKAIMAAKVPLIVNLSGIGAHLSDGPGPSGANHYIERLYNSLEGVNVLHLRPGMFYSNFYGVIGLIRSQGIIGNNFGDAVVLALTHPLDIARVAFDAIDSNAVMGKTAQYVVSDEVSGARIATALGQSIGMPLLKWVHFPDEAMFQSLIQQGLSPQMATTYIIDMGVALREGVLLQQYFSERTELSGNIRLEAFAKEFAVVYNSTN